MFKKGNWLFSASNLTLLLVAVLHTMGAFRKPVGTEQTQLIESMKSYRFNAMGMNWSIHDTLISVMLAMTVFMIFIAVFNFFIMYSVPSPVIRRRIILINALFMWLLALLFGVFQIPPPFVSFVLVAILFTVTFFRSSTKTERTP
jgi:hypothetical protein